MDAPSTPISSRGSGERPSKTARAMLEAKLKRVSRMSPRERMKLALRLGRQLRALSAEPKR